MEHVWLCSFYRKGTDFPFSATHCAAGFALSLLFTLNVHNSWQIWLSLLHCLFYRSLINKCTCTHKLHSATHKRTQLIHMHFFCLWDASSRSRDDWHPLVSTSVTLPAACEVGTEQQSEALGNICGQLQREEGAKERNLLLINKIMGAIRPFSHHHCLQCLSVTLSLSFSLYASPTLYLAFSIKKNDIRCLRTGWKTLRVWEKESKVEGGRKWGPDLQTNN